MLLIADSDVCCRAELRRFFSKRGFLVLTAADGLGCLDELVAMKPDVLVLALDIPWGGGDGVIARLNDGLPVGKKLSIFVIGGGPPKELSERTGVARCNCFSKPVHKEELLDRIGKELAIGRCDSGDGPCPAGKNARKTVMAPGTTK
jgi:DNA-binding response OmpR family regulator